MVAALSESIRVTVLYFSHLRHVLGRESEQFELPAGSTVAEVERLLRERAGGRLDAVTFRLAVNHAYVAGGHPLADGDEVALIAPVQGG